MLEVQKVHNSILKIQVDIHKVEIKSLVGYVNDLKSKAIIVDTQNKQYIEELKLERKMADKIADDEITMLNIETKEINDSLSKQCKAYDELRAENRKLKIERKLVDKLSDETFIANKNTINELTIEVNELELELKNERFRTELLIKELKQIKI